MSEIKKGKKRPKSYYIKCAAGKKRKRVNDLDIGMKGFLITCNTHEKEAVRESYNILNEYAEKLYGAEVHMINPIALRRAKNPWSFGHLECNRVKVYTDICQFMSYL